MNVKEERICRLCLKVAESDFQIIDENRRRIFEVLLLKVNLNISKDPIMCKDCAEVAEKCFNFKSACTSVEGLVFSNTIDKKKAKFELENIHKDGKDVDTIDANFLCRFCSNYLSESKFVSLDTLMNDVTFAKMLQQLMPEMDFDIIKDPIVCTNCKQNLECYIKFVENCLNVEEKIAKYLQNQGTPSSGHLRLSEIQHISFKNISEFDHALTRVIKQEILKEDIVEEHSEGNDGELIKTEELDIKDEKVNKSACKNPSDTSLYKLNIPCGSKFQMPSTVNISDTRIFKCAKCIYKTKYKGGLKKHMLIHKDITEVEMYKCSMCIYETRHKFSLKNHMLIHKDITEMELYKCSMCTYEAKQKSNLTKHMLKHQDITKVEMYKCSMCTFETKYKNYLRRHMIIHKDITEVEMFKCLRCTFQAKRKSTLKIHMLTHKDITEVKSHKCSMCTYETKHKHSLKNHMLIHKDVTEVEMYKCSMCTFQTKHRMSLVTHMLVHKDVTEEGTRKCSMCTYETRCKKDLRNHIKSHEDSVKVDMSLRSKIGSKIFEIMRR